MSDQWKDVDLVISVNSDGLLGGAEIRIPALLQFGADAYDVGNKVAAALGRDFRFLYEEDKESRP